MKNLALAGVRVLALENYVAGPLASMLLADWGAEVVKIEPPIGDAYRMFPPVIQGNDDDQSTPSFARINRDKRSVVLDVRHADDAKTFLDLVGAADVVIENLRPGTLNRIGIGFDVLREHNSDIILVSLSGFGQPDVLPGPLTDMPAFDLIGQAMSGVTFGPGREDQPPMYLGFPIADTMLGDWGAMAVLLALRKRDGGAGAQHIDVSMYDVMMHANEYALGNFAYTGELPVRGRLPTSAPFDFFRASDGYFSLAVSGNQNWVRLCEAMGMPDLAEDPRFADGRSRATVVEDVIRPIIEGWVGDRTVDEICQVLHASNVPCSPAQDAKAVYACEHARARNAWTVVPDRVLGDVEVVANPLKWRDEPAPAPGAPPRLGEHTDDVVEKWLEASPYDGQGGRRAGAS